MSNPRPLFEICQYVLADAQVARYFPKISCLGSYARANCEYVLAVLSCSWNFCLLSSRSSLSQIFFRTDCDFVSIICDVVLEVLSRTCSTDWVATLDCDIWLAHCNSPTRRFISEGSATSFQEIYENVLATPSRIVFCRSNCDFWMKVCENVLALPSRSSLLPSLSALNAMPFHLVEFWRGSWVAWSFRPTNFLFPSTNNSNNIKCICFKQNNNNKTNITNYIIIN